MKEYLLIVGVILFAMFVCAKIVVNILNRIEVSDLNDKKAGENIELGKESTFYEKYIKRGIDIFVAFLGLILTSPIIFISAVFIYFEDPGNVIFKQKRVGINKSFFYIHKLRSMRQNTGDIPTHLLSKEEQENTILKIGRFIRKTSIDELPQFIDIFRGRMSLIGPRPALWNQDDLIEEREKYGANNIRPGLTGWAQINGRDSISIEKKAVLDGVYTSEIRKSSFSGFKMDCKCFFGTIKSVLTSDGVVEGGTGTLTDEQENELRWIGTIPIVRKKILIMGKGSYIGERILEYLQSESNLYEVDLIETIDWIPRVEDFYGYDVVINVAGIAHVKETKIIQDLYYKVNRDLCIEAAKCAKKANVTHFIQFSTMSVYGRVVGHITKDAETNPISAYGASKLQADNAVLNMIDNSFKVAILRPPMVYGKNCKGNYQLLRKVAIKSPFFPSYRNERSMIFIDNLCEFVKNTIDERREGIFFPQNEEYVCTYEMVKMIAKENGKDILGISLLNPFISIIKFTLLKKVFGNLTYDKRDCVGKYSFEETIKKSEN